MPASPSTTSAPRSAALSGYAIAPYRQTNEPLPDEAAAPADLGVEFRLDTRIDAPQLRQLEAEVDAAVLAVAAATPTSPTRATSWKVWESLPFIERLKTGPPPHVGLRVAVIGGGNTAVDVAVEAKRLGADVSLLLYRRSEAEMPAYRHEVEPARREGVEIRLLTSPVAFVGDTHVEGVRCAEMRLGTPDESGRRRPALVPGSEFTIPVDTVVKAIGQRPRAEFRALLDSVDREGLTADSKIFAAGDAVNGGASRPGSRRRQARCASARGGAAMNDLPEVRWHARAGQGAKTASQILALAPLRTGKGVQAFPEYGPERRGRAAARLHARLVLSRAPARQHHRAGRRRRPRAVAPPRGESVTEGLDSMGSSS